MACCFKILVLLSFPFIDSKVKVLSFQTLMFESEKYKISPACALEVWSALKYEIIRGLINISAYVSLLIIQFLMTSVYLFLIQRNRGITIATFNITSPLFVLTSATSFLGHLKSATRRVIQKRWYAISGYLVFCFLHVQFWRHNYQFPHELFWDDNLCGIKVFQKQCIHF